MVAEWAEANYELARRHFSFTVLEQRLMSLTVEALGDRSPATRR
jgi:hypothetical protein